MTVFYCVFNAVSWWVPMCGWKCREKLELWVIKRKNLLLLMGSRSNLCTVHTFVSQEKLYYLSWFNDQIIRWFINHFIELFIFFVTTRRPDVSMIEYDRKHQSPPQILHDFILKQKIYTHMRPFLHSFLRFMKSFVHTWWEIFHRKFLFTF